MQESSDFIYSIGHGNKPIEQFIDELRANDIAYLMDVRSKPYSKWNSDFNQDALTQKLKQSNITYTYEGHNLGGLPSDRTCYDDDGSVLYHLIKNKDFFKLGLKRLLVANRKQIKVAVMCSETDPVKCHRTKLIGEALLEHNISMQHILTKTKVRPQELIINELTKGNSKVNLFGNTVSFKSIKNY